MRLILMMLIDTEYILASLPVARSVSDVYEDEDWTPICCLCLHIHCKQRPNLDG